MGWACGMYGGEEIYDTWYMLWVGTPKGKKISLGRPRRSCDDNIKTDPQVFSYRVLEVIDS